MTFDDIELDLGRFELRRGGEAVAVEPKVFDLIRFMAENANKLISKDELIEEVEQKEDFKEQSIRLVVIDTVHRNFGYGNENSAQEMGNFMRMMDRIRNHWKCTVLLIHHTGYGDKDRGRGSSSFRGTLDADYTLERSENIVKLKPQKMKDAEEPEPICLEFQKVELGFVSDDDNDEPVTSAILVHTEKPFPTADDDLKEKTKPEKALNILNQMYEKCRSNLLNGGENPEQALVKYHDWHIACQRKGLASSGNWSRTKNNLIENGKIRIEGDYVYLTEQPSS